MQQFAAFHLSLHSVCQGKHFTVCQRHIGVYSLQRVMLTAYHMDPKIQLSQNSKKLVYTSPLFPVYHGIKRNCLQQLH